MKYYRWLKLKLLKLLNKFVILQVAEHQYRKLHRILSLESEWNLNFIVLTITSCLIATFGLISNSTAVIIGAMIVAPLMLPLRTLSFAALEGDFRLFRQALLSIIGASLLALFLSCFTGIIVRIPEFGSEVLARTQPNLVDLGIAITAGFVSGFAKVRKGINDALAGTAIAVALMPPLCVVGLSLSQGLFNYSWGAFLLYLTNLLGICLACMIVFILAGYAKISQAFGWTMGLTLILLIPLGTSFLRLVKQEQIANKVTELLTRKTITVGQQVQQTQIKIDWTKNPPQIYINLATDKKITPKQVKLLEDFLAENMGQKFTCTVFVTQVNQVTSENPKQFDLDLLKNQ